MPEPKRDVHAWLQARVDEAGSVEASKPDGFTKRAWRDLCRHYNVRPGGPKINSLEAALEAVAKLAGP